MCFYIDQRNPNPIVATENIECYKVGYRITLPTGVDAFKSEFYDHVYLFNNKQPELQLKPRHDIILNCWFIQEGYHSYSNLTEAILNAHSDQVVARCIIPKGATYYYDPETNEYVSISLIVTNFLPSIKVD